MEAVITVSRERRCHLELNADPDRLDLNDIHVHAAKAAGVNAAISTDAHSTGGFANIRFGVDQAHRGWLEANDVINTLPLA
jgi:DNA polymerase (family 10)